MGDNIAWEMEIEAAFARAKSEEKDVFVCWYQDGCPLTTLMDANTYPDEYVSTVINQNIIPLKMAVTQGWEQPDAVPFQVQMITTLLIMDKDKRVYQRMVGYMPPEELAAWILLGLGKAQFYTGRFKQAISTLDKLIAESPTDLPWVTEGMYLRGVALFRHHGETGPLTDTLKQIQTAYGDLHWGTKRASGFAVFAK